MITSSLNSFVNTEQNKLLNNVAEVYIQQVETVFKRIADHLHKLVRPSRLQTFELDVFKCRKSHKVVRCSEDGPF